MTHIRLNRTFWPVGHGAFYTEQFYNSMNGCVFTAIYDCGSGNRWAKYDPNESPISVKEMVERYLPPRYPQGSTTPIRDIDIAFISHLHTDHINGIPTILGRIKNLVLPHLTDCKLLEAFLYNAFSANIGEDNEINGDGYLDTESEVQQFIIRLAQHDLREEGLSIIEVDESEADSSEEPINFDSIHNPKGTRRIEGGSTLRIPILPKHNIYWLYKLVNVDFSFDKCDELLAELNQYSPQKTLRDSDNKINWRNVAEAVRNAGIQNIVKIYEKVFGITKKNSYLHNSYSMPVYSGPDITIIPPFGVRTHMDVCIQDMFPHRIYSDIDIFWHHPVSHTFVLGQKMLSCLYMGDFNTKESQKFNQLRRILGSYYNVVGIQQVPHHFSKGNHEPELYRGPLFAFGNITGYRDRSFKKNVYDDIIKFGCTPLVVTKDTNSLVEFIYHIDFL